VVLTDSSGVLEARFVNVAVAHTFSVVKPETSMHAGDTVSVQLSPPTDRLDAASLGIVTATFDGIGATAPHYTWMDPNEGIGICGAGCANAAVQGSVATFVVPADAVGEVSLSLGEVGSSGTDKCDLAHCDMSFAARTNDGQPATSLANAARSRSPSERRIDSAIADIVAAASFASALPLRLSTANVARAS
jgi:hypothetical protein